jgi:hypothetical protein
VSQAMRFGADVRTEEDQRLAYWTGRLQKMLERRWRGIVTRQLLDECKEMVEDFRTRLRLDGGLNYPEVVLVYIREVGALEVVRADIDEANLQRWIVNLTVKYRHVTARGIAEALAEHFPGYRPGQMEFRRREPTTNGGVHPVRMTGVPV